MLLDQSDMLLLRLTGAYRWLPCDSLSVFGFGSLRNAATLLSNIKLVKLARSGKYIMLTEKACEFLTRLNYPADTEGHRAYDNSDPLRRRLEVASVMLTCLRAGIDTLQDDVDALAEQPTFYPAFLLRTGEINLMNAASCIGFGNWGNCAYMIQYVGADSRGMYQSNEMSQFRNLSSVFSKALRYPKAMIFAGVSYAEVYDRVHRRILPQSKSPKAYVDYSEVYADLDIPIHLLSCDETGATQLVIMRQPDYNARIARAAFGERIRADDEIPDADGRVDDFAFVVGVDMDIRRVQRIIDAARTLGRSEVVIAALPKQMDFYTPLFADDEFVTLRAIPDAVLQTAFGDAIRLFEPDSTAPAITRTGGTINA